MKTNTKLRNNKLSAAQCLVSITTFLFTFVTISEAHEISSTLLSPSQPLRLMLSPARAERLHNNNNNNNDNKNININSKQAVATTTPDTSNHNQTQPLLLRTTEKPQIQDQSQAPNPVLLLSSAISSNPSATTTPTTETTKHVNVQTTTTTTTTTPTRAPKTTTTTTGQPLENTWIESILIQVEDSLNQHSRIQAPSGYEEEEEKSLLGGSSSSLAPTDSGEDPLESTTTIATDKDQPQHHGTQYSIAGQSPSNVITITAPTTTTNTSSSSSNNNEEENSSSSLLEEQRLVDSNNVSAIVAMNNQENNNNNPISDRHSASISHIVPTTTTTTGEPRQPVGCDQAYTQCALRKVCAPALKSYNDDCQELINNRTSQCSPKCLKAMIALRSSEEGDDLVNCDCQGNEYCLHSKQRSQACRPQVEQAVDPKTVVSCSTASWICLADQLCSTALDYYYRYCQSLFSQRHCSMRCNNSLSILYRQPKASKLINCQCDGSEEFPCVKYKTYTERLCLNKQLTTSQTSAGGNLEDNAEEDEEPLDGSGSDDNFNMTNDPETFVLGSQESQGFGNADNFDDEDETGNSKGVAGGSEESSSALNGIQLVEDNWIPLMSGRYFTNLHQQQMRRQQQQHHKQARQKQVQSGSPSSSSSSSSSLAAPASQRKSPKNSKQKSNNSQSRRPHNRILVFASTSSSAPPTCLRPPLLTILAAACLFLVVYPLGSHIIFIRLLLH